MKSVSVLEEFVNLTELMDRVENDEELLTELLTLFQADLPENRAALQTAVDKGDLRQIEQAAHRLKGMLANLSAKHGAAQAAEIESTARAGNAQKVRELVSAFDHWIMAFSAALDSLATRG
jgi:two-component system, sensor histidine kinase and response regulator